MSKITGQGRRNSQHSFDCGKDRLRLHHHPTAAAVRLVIGDVVAVASPIANVMKIDDDQPALAGALQDAAFEIGSENLGKERENIESERQEQP